eukprot:gnl/TRDRNA2_/TRDRNA2_168714_c0_seq1.p1 gnl/TRDRNA2_/TRDRNA2_168714_c0~~gnl/TRDRNA2_/TRDRNA2_168714_c0_seq1.p1  ORF type:complete len:344 (-),score=32.61 gnl/TRDRNA2_/TRDRNA2_168714_c0_seq1:271-1302(-)
MMPIRTLIRILRVWTLDPSISAVARASTTWTLHSVGKDLFGAPYDWRLSGDAHAERKNSVGGLYHDLKTLIEQAMARNDGRRVTVISHSLGGLTMHYFFHVFVSEAWRAQHIKMWVALSSPWGGAVQQGEVYLGSTTSSFPWSVLHKDLRPLQVRAPSGVWLSPQPFAFGNQTIFSTPSMNYTAAQLPELISTIGAAAGGKQIEAAFKKDSINLKHFQAPPKNVPMHVWYSTGLRTPEQVSYTADIAPGFEQDPAEVQYGDGDTAVNLVSLQVPEKAWPKDPSAPVEIGRFEGVSHHDMVSDPDVMTALLEVLLGLTRKDAQLAIRAHLTHGKSSDRPDALLV